MSPRTAIAGRLDPDDLAALEEQRDFLLASLADLEREHDAGDLDDDDLANLRDEYTARAAEVLRAIDEQRLAFSTAKRPRDLKRSALWVGLVAVFAVVSGILVAQSLGARKAGETSSGTAAVKETSSQRAQKCIQLISPTAPKAAIDCFQKVRAEDPDNVVALTFSSWQLTLAAEYVPADVGGSLLATANEQLAKAVALEPEYSQARAFRAVVAYRSGQLDEAEQYLADFYEHDPEADSAKTLEDMDLAGQIAKARQAADDPASSTTTTPGSGTTTTATPGG